MKHSSSRLFAVVLAFACAPSDGHAQEEPGCKAFPTIQTFCANRRTISSVVKFPQVKKLNEVEKSSRNRSYQARVTISCDHPEGEVAADPADGASGASRSPETGMSMWLWHESIGTIGLTYSRRLDPAGLVFSTVQYEQTTRRNASGTTPGTFALLNRCALANGNVDGLIFDGNLIVPLSFKGDIDQDWFERDISGTLPPDLAKMGPKARALAISKEDVKSSPAADPAPTDSAKWDFSGIYEFEMEDEPCLIKHRFMKKYQDRSPEEMLGLVPEEMQTHMLEMRKSKKHLEKTCPPTKGWLVIDAVAGDMPIFLLGHGSFVSHHLAATNWEDGKQFHSITPNGDTTGPNGGMFKIDGVIKDGRLHFYVFRPNLGKTGRMWPVTGLANRWIALEPFVAEKKRDIYCHLNMSPTNCDEWNKKDWDSYIEEMWKYNKILPRIN
jgi:hypothetical protein